MTIFKKLGLCALTLTLVATLHATETDRSTDNVMTITNSSNAFGNDLYTHLSKDGNTLFSPYSLHSALLMAYAGARGTTEKEMSNVLHLAIPQEESHAAAATLKTTLGPCPTCCDPSCELKIANKLYVQDGYDVFPDFVGTMSKHYDVAWQQINFSENRNAADQINSWVSKETNNKINDLVSPSDLNALTRLVLVNALYFNAKWEKPFTPSSTQPSLFYCKDNETTMEAQPPVVADMMLQTEAFHYMENEIIQMIELPYANSSLSMNIILPKEVEGITDVEKTLSQETLNTWCNQLVEEEVTIKLPRFKIESSYNLNGPLIAMGMPSAFDEADFSGISKEAVNEGLQISKVIHKASVEVAEEGTEAAAAGAVIMQLKCLAPVFKSPFTKVFSADHPFIFLIRDTNTNITLFMGKVAEIVD